MDTREMWHSAVDALPKESELETIDQRIAYANVIALLSISQEINGFVLGESPLAEKLMDRLSKARSGRGGVW